jgi:membrane-bound metal-dependent hydrolase YbcI (DUF457 family)
MAEKYQENAFILSLVAGILITVGGVLMSVLGAICGFCIAGVGSARGQAGAGLGAGLMVLLLMSLGVISGILVLVGAMLIHRGDVHSIKNGSFLVIIFSLLGLAGLNPLSLIGTVIGLIGGIIGITGKPGESQPPSSPPPS